MSSSFPRNCSQTGRKLITFGTGRVVVMTTNHPEKLDPALIRRGRINKKIHLGFVDADTLLKMLGTHKHIESPKREDVETEVGQQGAQVGGQA